MDRSVKRSRSRIDLIDSGLSELADEILRQVEQIRKGTKEDLCGLHNREAVVSVVQEDELRKDVKIERVSNDEDDDVNNDEDDDVKNDEDDDVNNNEDVFYDERSMSDEEVGQGTSEVVATEMFGRLDQLEREVRSKVKKLGKLRERNMMSAVFSFRDIEESLSTFSGDDAYNVRKWIEDTECSAEMFAWNGLQKLMFGKRLLKGTAKMFLRTIDVNSWDELKECLLEQFDVKLSDADVHRMLGDRKKLSKEALQEYLITMCEIGKQNDVEEESIIQYVVDGIDDELCNKSILYGASSMKDFRLKSIAYEKFRLSLGQQNEVKDEVRCNVKLVGSISHGVNRCYSCGDEGHIAMKCPRKSDGVKCFACNEFGHRSMECPAKKDVKDAAVIWNMDRKVN